MHHLVIKGRRRRATQEGSKGTSMRKRGAFGI